MQRPWNVISKTSAFYWKWKIIEMARKLWALWVLDHFSVPKWSICTERPGLEQLQSEPMHAWHMAFFEKFVHQLTYGDHTSPLRCEMMHILPSWARKTGSLHYLHDDQPSFSLITTKKALNCHRIGPFFGKWWLGGVFLQISHPPALLLPYWSDIDGLLLLIEAIHTLYQSNITN